MYEVFCWVHTVSDVNNFIGKTDRFSKRFYTIGYEERDKSRNQHTNLILIEAIAISRDLVYILHWNIECEVIPELAAMDDDAGLEHPPFGYMPIDKEPTYKNFLDEWFPCRSQGSYVNVFEYNGFARVNKISKLQNTAPLNRRW